MKMSEEMWQPVFGYEGLYEVSDCGRVRRIGRDAIGRARYVGKVLAAHPVRGYPKVILHKAGSYKHCQVHILVAEAFLGERKRGFVVNHKNGDKSDASVGNLEYVTPSENHRHALANRLFVPPRGERHWSAKLTDVQVREISRRANAGERNVDLAHEFGTRPANVSRYKTGASRLAQ